MKIDFQETTNDLLKRIDIHNKFGSKDIDQWMLSQLQLKKGLTILDVACGAGKQCFSFYDYLNGDCNITGTDVSPDLLTQARQLTTERKSNIEFLELDFNKPFQLSENKYDLVSCCFAIYYAADIPFTIKEMHRVIKPGGRLFTTGPMPENKKLFYEIIKEATNKTIPPMPGSSRYGSEILTTIKNTFSDVRVEIFENPLTFSDIEPFIEYTRASLSEDRKLWSAFFQEKDDFEKIMKEIARVAEYRLKKEGKLVMTKVVGGIFATK